MRGQIRVIDSNETAMELLGVVDKFKENHQDIDVVNGNWSNTIRSDATRIFGGVL